MNLTTQRFESKAEVAPDLGWILDRASNVIGNVLPGDWKPMTLSNPFDRSAVYRAACCRSGERSGYVVIATGSESCIVVPPCPVIHSIRRNLADLSDRSLPYFPPSASGFGFIPVPDGPVQITFFKIPSGGGDVALSALRCPKSSGGRNLSLSDRNVETLSALLGADVKLHPALQALLDDDRWHSMTFDLCGNRLPGLVQYQEDYKLLPLWAATNDGVIFPLLQRPSSPIDLQAIADQVTQILAPSDHVIGSRMRSRGQWLCLTDQAGALLDASVLECNTDAVERDNWMYFDAELEHRVRRAFRGRQPVNATSLQLPPKKWYWFQEAIRNFVAAISRPNPSIKLQQPQQVDSRTMLILCGFPGCGKSYFSQALLELTRLFVRVNQDELGSRDACLRTAREALQRKLSVIIDRTNISIQQRAFFIDLARREHVPNVIAVLFDVRPEICASRILNRDNHPTLASHPSSIDVLRRFMQRFERPCLEEGFQQVLRVSSEAESKDLTVTFASMSNPSESLELPCR